MTQRSEGERWGWARSGHRHVRTGFIGRAEALAMVRAAVDDARVITLTGPGGVGKTRVALQGGQELRAGWFPDGVSIAELSGLRDAEFLPDTVASAVGVPEAAGLEPIDQLIEYFSDKRALLVLDQLHFGQRPGDLAVSGRQGRALRVADHEGEDIGGGGTVW